MDSRLERKGEYWVTDERDRLDVDAIHAFLTQSYWARGITKELVAKSMQGSLCFGLFHNDHQIGFARVITDQATFAYLCDVYVLDTYRGQGLGTWLVQFVLAHPSLAHLRRFVLVTRDSHSLYKKLGFGALGNPAGYLEILTQNIYASGPSGSGR